MQTAWRMRVNTDHLEFSGHDLRKRTHGRSQSLKKGDSCKSRSLGELIWLDLKHRPGAHEPRFDRPQGGTREVRSKSLLECLQVVRRFQQTRTPCCESRRDLIVIFFGDELVRTCLHLQERLIERGPRSIVRMQVKLTIW